jgi:hypothetical protein
MCAAIPDAVSMLLVERMALSTKTHHTIVVIFMVVNLYVTFEVHPHLQLHPRVRPSRSSLALHARGVAVPSACHLCGNCHPSHSTQEETVGRALVVYAIFSTFAYLVNLLLATRFLPVPPLVRLLMSTLALAVYGGCLAVNWTWQVLFVSRIAIEQPNLSLAVYLFLITFVVWDDCVLLQWLWHNVGRTARGLAKTKGKMK